ncbi:hypothetical protein BS78_05G061900 [Paspalum vaginatum]|nr:hypothetical protein BS78_05G061900 [Paspalum vaginatum]
MRRSQLLLPATLIIMVLYCGATSSVDTVDTVIESCNIARKHVDLDFCLSRLRSVPGSSSADQRGHYFMAIDLAAVSAVMAWDTATRMAHGESDPVVRDALEACGYLYWAASMPALRMYHGYAEVRNWGSTESLQFLIAQAGIGCDAALRGGGAAVGKMVTVNREFMQLSTMADLLYD